jgi:DNA-binding LacI/PurR family transcriptional regulator
MQKGKATGTATINDIALKAGVSSATVSRSMRGKEWVSPETRAKIFQVATQLNYHPNLQARALVSQNSNGVGIIIPRSAEFAFANPYYAENIKGIAKGVKESGQHLVFSFAGEDGYARMYQNRLVAGIIVLGHRIDDPRIEQALKMKVPMVLIPGYPYPHSTPSVDMDNIGGAQKAVDHLATLGHKRIAFINGAINSKYSIDRLKGYRNGLEKSNLPFQKNLVFESDFTQEGAYMVMKKILLLPEIPTAVLLINDHIALGVLKAVKESPYRVPEDISIVGFGDVPFACMIYPPLTTVREPSQEIGYEAARMCLKLIQGKRVTPKHSTIPMELIVRESAVPPSS